MAFPVIQWIENVLRLRMLIVLWLGASEAPVAGGAEYFGGAFLVGSTHCHPSLHVLPHFYKWGNVVPMSIFLLHA